MLAALPGAWNFNKKVYALGVLRLGRYFVQDGKGRNAINY